MEHFIVTVKVCILMGFSFSVFSFKKGIFTGICICVFSYKIHVYFTRNINSFIFSGQIV